MNNYIPTKIDYYILNENSNTNNIFYHISKKDFDVFSKQLRNNIKVSEYLFFSEEINGFITGDYLYTVELDFNPKKIFNSFKFSENNNYGIEFTLEKYIDDVKELFKNNLEYFYNEWIQYNVDSPENVLEYFTSIGGDENDKVGLLYYFLTEWNDSFAIIESNKFLEFLETKGFDGFITMEEGIFNIALRYYNEIKILKKEKI